MDADVRADLRAKGPLTEIDLDFDVDDLHVIPGAVNGFAEKHRLDRDAAREGLLDTVDLLLEKGLHRIDARGANILFGDGYRVVVSGDLQAVLAYATLHHERTLKQVRSGVQSRLRGKPVDVDGLLEALDDDMLDVLPIPHGPVDAHLGRDASREEREDFRMDIRDAIASVLDELEDAADRSAVTAYKQASTGEHVLAADGLVVVLRSDGLRVLDVLEGDSVDVFVEKPQQAQRSRRARRPRRRSRSGDAAGRVA